VTAERPEKEKTLEITRLLRSWSRGDKGSFEALVPIVYDELKRIARSQMRSERSGHTLQTTAVVHEAFLRLVDQRQIGERDRSYFFGAAARIMRRLLIDHARLHRAQKRGAGLVEPLEEEIPMDAGEAEELLALDEAMADLERLDQRQCRIVELRHFGGLTVEETADLLEISPATVKRDWRLARTWLHRRLASGGEMAGSRA
jgi:RNA polymerase sigma factor (TIGR02999 family)